MYNHQEIEKKWQKKWAGSDLYKAEDFSQKPKWYTLIEFPYPSGAGLHVGHVRPYMALDAISRTKRMQGHNVLYPIGWDAFGLPTENYAIKNKIHPTIATAKNIATFTRQIKSLGISFDWSREINTTDPKYYKWTQWIFLKFFEHGLAYKKKMPINWCLSCKIGLANEEVIDGKCERCGGQTEKREKEQWMLAITKYAERLINDLDTVDYLEKIKAQQIHWIGKSEGAEIKFPISNFQFPNKLQNSNSKTQFIEIFTTRPDTIFGATYMVLAPEHPLITNYKLQITNYNEVERYINDAKKKSELERIELQKEKTGVELKGIKAINPANHEEIPIWIADYVLTGYGAGAIMAVPGHDERDFEFAKKYDLPIKFVIEPNTKTPEKSGAFGGSEGYYPQCGTRTCHSKYIINHNNFFVKSLKSAEPVEGFEPSGHGMTSPDPHHATGKSAQDKLYQKNEKKTIKCFLEDGINVNSEFLNGLPTQMAKEKIINWLEEKNFGKRKINYKLRDWIFSRQHYWGEPIPLVFCPNCAKDNSKTPEKSGVFGGSEGCPQCRTRNCHLDNSIDYNKNFVKFKKDAEPVEGFEPSDSEVTIPRPHQATGNTAPEIFYHKNDSKTNCIIVHGFEGQAQSNFFPWTMQELKKIGYEVILEDMPNSYHPKIQEWLTALNKYKDKINEETIIIGHSMGGSVAPYFVKQLRKKIKALYLIAPTTRLVDFVKLKNDWPNSDIENLEKIATLPINWEVVKSCVKKIKVFLSDNDDCIPLSTNEFFANQQIESVILSNRGHIQDEQFPELIEEIKNLDNLNFKFNIGELSNPGWIPIPEDQLPIELPNIKSYEPTDTGESPLANITDWVNTTCPKCGGPAKRETDTMPNWAGSSWYFLRYIDPKNDNALADPKKLKYWLPVDLYNGGMEHTTLHLLYSRFWHKFLYDIGIAPTSEPYARRRSHGMVLAEDGKKMSKSLGNVVNPDDIVNELGADTLRVYEMFMGPFDQAIPWSTDGARGVKRFLDKIWRMREKISNFQFPISKQISNSKSQIPNSNSSIEFLLHKTIKKVTEDIENFKFNTVISALMILVNDIEQEENILITNYQLLITLLSPFAPHLAEELWEQLGNVESIFKQSWPKYDPALIKDETIELVIQVNGKVRDKFEVSADISEADTREKVLASEKIKQWLAGGEPKKIIFVKGKLVNIVI